MNKRMREIQAEILKKSKEANDLLEGENKDVAKAASILDEVDALQKEFETLERAEKAKKAGLPGKVDGIDGSGEKVDVVKVFADAVRSRFKDLNEGSGVDGGYTVPEDVQTAVIKYKEQRFSLRSLIDSETVTAQKGRRTYKNRSQHEGFTLVGEGGKIAKVKAPAFSIMEYDIKKYAGFMPVTNELLEDSDAAIYNLMVEWLGEEEIATENAQILDLLFDSKEAVELTGINDIKKAINVDLAAYAGTCGIVTNADGLQYLDTLEDANNRPLLSPDPTKPMEMFVSVGVRRIPVTVVPNEILASDPETGAIPFIMGDLKEYMKEFDRKKITLSVSNVAAIGELNAYEQDLTLVRAIMRADWQIKDPDAVVYGTIIPA